MRTDWKNELATVDQDIKSLQKKRDLIVQLAALEGEVVTEKSKTTKVAKPKAPAVPGAEPKKRGRPRKVQPEGQAEASGDGKAIKLPALLKTIGQSLTKPVTMVEIVDLVRKAGYVSEAKDYSNMVYQGLTKLVDKGHFTKTTKADDPTTRIYEWVPNSDAA